MPVTSSRARGLLALALLAAAPVGAQPVVAPEQELGFDRPESWAMKYYGSVLLFTGFGAAEETAPGSVELALDGGWVPSLSAEQRTVGFAGTKEEDLNRAPVYGRPRVTFGLPADWSLTVSYLPEVEISEVEAELAALAVERPLWRGRRWRVAGRVAAQWGMLAGDITCPADVVAAGADPRRNPLECEAPSADEMTLRSGSVELATALAPVPGGRVEPYVTLAGHRFDTDFQVDARYSGILDRTLLLTEGTTWSLAGGVGYAVSRSWRLAAEAFYSPLDVERRAGRGPETDALFTVRGLLAYRLRP